jgi:hypothetical protein
MVDEAERFLARHLEVSSPSLLGLMSGSESYVSGPIAFLYDLPSSAADSWVTHDPAERYGIFTMPAFLASHSGPVDSRLLHRGVHFTRKVMCVSLGAPPPNAPLAVPEMEGATARESVEAITTGGTCAGCHNYINPFGFALESFDALGRYRTVDENGLPIDPSIDHAFLGSSGVHTDTAVEALQAFTSSPRFQQCFTRQMFRFYVGRDEQSGDDPLLRRMFFQFAVEGRQDILASLRTLAGSPELARREAP